MAKKGAAVDYYKAASWPAAMYLAITFLLSILSSIVVVAEWIEIAPGVGAAEMNGLEPKWARE